MYMRNRESALKECFAMASKELNYLESMRISHRRKLWFSLLCDAYNLTSMPISAMYRVISPNELLRSGKS